VFRDISLVYVFDKKLMSASILSAIMIVFIYK